MLIETYINFSIPPQLQKF